MEIKNILSSINKWRASYKEHRPVERDFVSTVSHVLILSPEPEQRETETDSELTPHPLRIALLLAPSWGT